MGLVIPNPISLRGLKSPIAYHSLTSGDIPWSWNSKGLEGLQQLVQLSWSFLVFGIMDVETQLAVNGNPRKARKCLESKPQTRKILPGNLPFKAHPPLSPMESMNIFTVVSLCVCISCTGAFQVILKPGKCRHRLKRMMSHSFWIDLFCCC